MTDQGAVPNYQENEGESRPQWRYIFGWVARSGAGESRLLTGWMGLAASEVGLTRLLLPSPSLTELLRELQPAPSWRLSWTPLLRRSYWQVRAYLSGHLKEFSIPLDLGHVSGFQARVLGAAQSVGWGETCSYGELAEAVGSAEASRAVGQALASNPVALVVPCHRIVGSDGGMVGFGGGVEQKLALLGLEGVTVAGESV